MHPGGVSVHVHAPAENDRKFDAALFARLATGGGLSLIQHGRKLR
jgi:hypothetical protein